MGSFVLIVYLLIFSEIKKQNFPDDALLVQEIHAFIHFLNDWFKPVFLTDNFSLPLKYPNIVTFHLISSDLRGGNDKNILLKNEM